MLACSLMPTCGRVPWAIAQLPLLSSNVSVSSDADLCDLLASTVGDCLAAAVVVQALGNIAEEGTTSNSGLPGRRIDAELL
jgi:hypothetical protein